jgi:glycosyltransferase involved in cell wall biosynthesis
VKILHILKHTARANGNVCAMVDLACTQARSGHDVRVLSGGGHFDGLLARYGIQHIEIPHASKSPRILTQLWRVYRALRTFGPDVVHAHMMTSAVVAAGLRPLLGFKLVTTVHNEFQPSARLMGVGQRVIGVSEAVTRSMIRRGIPASKMRTVLNGATHSPRFPEPPPPPLPLRRPAVVFVGGMHPRKGVDDLITAFGRVAQRVPDAHLYLVGSGPMQAEYERLAQQAAPGRCEFCGHSDDPRPYMAGADIFVLASRADPAPLVVAEARAAGCAVVATKVGGIPEMMEGGEAGILVEPDRPDLLAGALSSLLEDPDYLARVRAQAQVNIGKMSVDRMTADTESVYRELLGLPRLRERPSSLGG